MQSTDHEMSTMDASLPSPSPDGDGAKDLEKQDGFLRPIPSAARSQLTPSISRKSKTGSQLSPSWSYVDGHSGYFRRGDEDDEDDQANSESPAEEKQFEVKFDQNDPLNPRNRSTARKWLVVFTLALGSLCVTCVSSIYTTTYDQIDVEFHSSTLVSTLGLTLFVWGLALAPMVLGPISEFYGRRPVYIGAFFFFTIWLIPCGRYAPSFQLVYPD
jgi:hypothetical protein